MLAAVSTAAPHIAEIIGCEFKRGLHLYISKRPRTVRVIELECHLGKMRGSLSSASFGLAQDSHGSRECWMGSDFSKTHVYQSVRSDSMC